MQSYMFYVVSIHLCHFFPYRPCEKCSNNAKIPCVGAKQWKVDEIKRISDTELWRNQCYTESWEACISVVQRWTIRVSTHIVFNDNTSCYNVKYYYCNIPHIRPVFFLSDTNPTLTSQQIYKSQSAYNATFSCFLKPK